MSVAVVTPWLGHEELWEGYERAIINGPPPDELLVVDNGSEPPLSFGNVRNSRNRGFAGACNRGLWRTSADVVVFLNNDIEGGTPGWLERLAAAVEPGVLAGPRIRTASWADVDGVRIPYLDGWCLAGRRDELRTLGGFDETLAEPAYYSDNLLCVEARAAGMRLREVSGLGLRHLRGMTSKADPAQIKVATDLNRAVYERRARELLQPAPSFKEEASWQSANT